MTVFERTTLGNGVRVLTAPMSHVQSTACYVMLAAGSRYEHADSYGAAHFVEHMMFCGTSRRPSVRALTGEVDAIGGLFNAGTGKENTVYYVKVASQYARNGLDVLADMIQNSLFDESEVEREKGVIVEEIRAKQDAPKNHVEDNWELLLYGDTPLGHWVIGAESTVTGMSRETLVDFVRDLYEPSRLIVGLAGRVDDDVVDAVEELFGSLEGSRAPDPEPVVAANGGSRVLVEQKPIDQAHLAVGMRTYPLSHPDRWAVHLLSTVLGGGMSSRLIEELTMRQGVAYSVFTVAENHTDAGSMWAQGGVNLEKVDDAIRAIVAELHRVREEPVGADELDKARNYAKGRFVFSTETPQGLIGHGLRGEVLQGRPWDPDEVVAELDRVTPDDVQRVAHETLAGGLYLVAIGPFDDAGRFEALIAS